MADVTFNAEQQAAFDGISQMYYDYLTAPYSDRNVSAILVGSAGRGKTFLTTHILKKLAAIEQMLKYLEGNEVMVDRYGTAMTNQATNVLREFCENLEGIGEVECKTPHNMLALKVVHNWQTGETHLTDRDPYHVISNSFVIVDEASMLDEDVSHKINTKCKNCFVLYVLDEWQILNVGDSRNGVTKPFVLKQGYPEFRLTQPMRFGKNSSIAEVTEAFLQFAITGQIKPFNIDHKTTLHVSRDEFEKMIIADKDGLRENRSHVVCWRNNTVLKYNTAIMREVFGREEIDEGDFVICNEFTMLPPVDPVTLLPLDDARPIATNATVRIKQASDHVMSKVGSVPGRFVLFEYCGQHFHSFLPDDVSKKFSLLKQLRAQNRREPLNTGVAKNIKHVMNWLDLRPGFAMTADKSQGSTFDTVYIDLNDFSAGMFDVNNISRRLYVASSRASKKLVFTGEL